MFLSKSELAELTDRKLNAHQIHALGTMKIACVVSADGRPKVLRSHVEALLGSNTGAQIDSGAAQPNWGEMNA